MPMRHRVTPTGNVVCLAVPLVARDPSSGTVHARACVRQRAHECCLLVTTRLGSVDAGSSAGAAASVTGNLRRVVSAVGSHGRRVVVPPLPAAAPIGEGALSEEGLVLTHDEEDEDNSEISAAPGSQLEQQKQRYSVHTREVVVEQALAKEEREGRGHVETQELDHVQLLQRALISRLKTLEERRDWRGVLAAMVRNMSSTCPRYLYSYTTSTRAKNKEYSAVVGNRLLE